MANAQPKRCTWVNVDQVLMREYHDREWGVPTHDDRKHFEFLGPLQLHKSGALYGRGTRGK